MTHHHMYYYALIDTVYNDTNDYCIFIFFTFNFSGPATKASGDDRVL